MAVMNNDKVVDIVDAFFVAQYYVNLISELNCDEPIVTDEPTPTPGLTTYELQAEEAEWSSGGGVESEHTGYTGSGYVNTNNSSGEWIEWTVELAGSGNGYCVFTYACADVRPVDLSVHGITVAGLAMPASGLWRTWVTEEANVRLNAGLNKIRLTAIGGSGTPDLDKPDITTAPTPDPTETHGHTLTPGPNAVEGL